MKIKFGQLIEYNTRNIFLKSHIQNAVKNIIVCQVEDYRNILKLSCRPLAFTSYKAFAKSKKEVWD